MASTTGYVQQLTLLPGPLACAWIGPEPDDAELVVTDAFAGVLAQAQMTGEELQANHPDDSAHLTDVGTTACILAFDPLHLETIEVTQAVQDLSQSVPLIAGKRTVVRVYLSNSTTAPLTVRGELTVRQAPTGPVTVIASEGTALLDPAHAGDLPALRNQMGRSLDFVLPEAQTAEGPLTVSLSAVIDEATGAALEVACPRRPTLWFHHSPPLRIRVLGMRYTMGSPPVTYVPSLLDWGLLFSWLRRVYPVGEIISSTALVTATAAPSFTSGQINAQLAAIRALDMDAGEDNRTHYYGFVSDGGFFMRGSAAGIPSSPDPTTVCCGPTGPGSNGWDFDGSYGDWYGGHELAHTFGRRHPGFCGETQSDLANYPYPNGQLAGSADTFAGFDVGDALFGLPMQALPGLQWRDVMTYCNNQWMSAYTYQGIRLRLIEEDALGSAAAAGPMMMDAAAATPEQARVSVVATVNLTRGEGRIEYVNPVPNASPTPAAPDSPVVLRVLGGDGQVLTEQPVAFKPDTELVPGEDVTGLVDAVLAVGAGASVVELVMAGRPADTYQAGGAPSAEEVSVRLAPGDSADSGLTLDLGRPREGGETYYVQVSTDDGQTWSTVGVGLRDARFTVDTGQFTRGQQVRVRVTGTTGFASSVLSDETVTA